MKNQVMSHLILLPGFVQRNEQTKLS